MHPAIIMTKKGPEPVAVNRAVDTVNTRVAIAISTVDICIVIFFLVTLILSTRHRVRSASGIQGIRPDQYSRQEQETGTDTTPGIGVGGGGQGYTANQNRNR